MRTAKQTFSLPRVIMPEDAYPDARHNLFYKLCLIKETYKFIVDWIYNVNSYFEFFNRKFVQEMHYQEGFINYLSDQYEERILGLNHSKTSDIKNRAEHDILDDVFLIDIVDEEIKRLMQTKNIDDSIKKENQPIFDTYNATEYVEYPRKILIHDLIEYSFDETLVDDLKGLKTILKREANNYWITMNIIRNDRISFSRYSFKSTGSMSRSTRDKFSRCSLDSPICSRLLSCINKKNNQLKTVLMDVCSRMKKTNHSTNDVRSMITYKTFLHENDSMRVRINVKKNMSEIETMRKLYKTSPFHLYCWIERVTYAGGFAVDAGGVRRQFLTNLSEQFALECFTKINKNIFIIKRDMMADDYVFIGAMFYFLIKNASGIQHKIALIDFASMIYSMPTKRELSELDIPLNDYGDFSRFSMHYKESNGNKSWKEDVRKNVMTYYDMLVCYILDFIDIKNNNNDRTIIQLLNEDNIDVKKLVENNVIDLFQYTISEKSRMMYNNILKGMKIRSRKFFVENRLSIGDLSSSLSFIEPLRKKIGTILIPELKKWEISEEHLDTFNSFINLLKINETTYRKFFLDLYSIDKYKELNLKPLKKRNNFIKALLEFWTGSPYIVDDSISEYNIFIADSKGLPMAHTCGYQLDLSNKYKNDIKLMYQDLAYAILLNGSEFGFI